MANPKQKIAYDADQHQYPRMLYKGTDYRIADDAEHEKEVRAEGFTETTPAGRIPPKDMRTANAGAGAAAGAASSAAAPDGTGDALNGVLDALKGIGEQIKDIGAKQDEMEAGVREALNDFDARLKAMEPQGKDAKVEADGKSGAKGK